MRDDCLHFVDKRKRLGFALGVGLSYFVRFKGENTEKIMNKFRRVVSNCVKPLVFGVVHLDALPGTPRYRKSIDKISEKAKCEARILKEEGVDGIIVENMGDIPFVRPQHSGPEIVSCMTRLALDVKKSIPNLGIDNFLWGISFLAACNEEALAVAMACGYDFVRSEGYVFAHIADEGFIDGCAGSLLRYRKKIGADRIAIITDVKKKHSAHSITADVSLASTVEAAEFFASDGVIVTGAATGHAPTKGDVQEAKEASRRIPIIVGSGVNSENVHQFIPYTSIFIVGSDFKVNGHWENDMERERVKKFMQSLRR